VGYNLGILYYQFKREQNKSKFWVIKLLSKRVFRIGIPLCGVVGLFLVAYSFHDLNSVTLSSGYFAYFGILRTVVPLLMILVMLPTLFGFGSAVKEVCESRTCNLVSKLSLSIYGIHYLISLYLVYYRQCDLELSNFTVVFLACCTIIPSILLAIVLTSVI
jgi:surface polysaccharide O-acyltransferase-like enzyme